MFIKGVHGVTSTKAIIVSAIQDKRIFIFHKEKLHISMLSQVWKNDANIFDVSK